MRVLIPNLGHHISGTSRDTVDNAVTADGGDSWIFRGPGDGGGCASNFHGHRRAAHLHGEVGVVQRCGAGGGGTARRTGASGGGAGAANIDGGAALGCAVGYSKSGFSIAHGGDHTCFIDSNYLLIAAEPGVGAISAGDAQRGGFAFFKESEVRVGEDQCLRKGFRILQRKVAGVPGGRGVVIRFIIPYYRRCHIGIEEILLGNTGGRVGLF